MRIMKKIRKSISLILALLTLSAFMPTALASYMDTDDSDILLVSGLGLMEGYDDGTFLPENTITRAEFAQIIANIYLQEADSLKEWQNMYFKDQSAEQAVITDYSSDDEPRFSDVDSSHWAYEAVNTVYSLGYMEGVSENEFAPDDKLTAPQIYKILSVMLGYRVKAVIKGGYPRGYTAVANEIGLSRGVKASGEVTRGDVAKILVNAFDAQMLYPASLGDKITYESYEDKTFLTELMGLNKVSGRMTDNGLTALDSKSTSYEDNITVDGKTVRLTEETEHLRDFIGRDVDIYCREDENTNINYSVFGMLNNKDEAVVFDADDFVGTELNSISYKLNNSEKKLKLKNGTPLIKNGMAIEVPAETDFNVNKGTYTVIKSKGSSAYDLIILDSYVSFYVDSVDSVSKKIYSENTLIDGKNVDFSDENKVYFIYDSEGEQASFEKIAAGDILSVSDSDSYLKAYISKDIVAGFTVDGKYSEKGDTFITSGNTKYRVSKDFIELWGDTLEVSKKYTLYLDKFGEVINAVFDSDSGVSVALMMDAKKFGDVDEEYQIKYFNYDGAIKASPIAQRVTLINSDGVESSVKDMDALMSQIAGYDELFRYKLNANKEICYIELASNQKESGNPKNRLLRLRLSDSVSPEEYTADPYYKPNNAINGKAVVDNNTTVAFVHPSDFSNEELFRVTDMTQVLKDDGNTGKYVMAYTTEGDSPFANYVISREDTAATLPATDKLFAVVKEISKGVNLKGEPMNVITVYEKGSSTETLLYCEDSVLNDVRDFWGRKHSDYDEENGVWSTDAEKYKIEMGDIIRYTQNADKTLKKIYLIFDENAKNPHSGGQGNLAGSYGYYNSALTETDGVLVAPNVNSSPWSVTNSGVTFDDYDETYTNKIEKSDFSLPLRWDYGELRAILAYPVFATSNTMTVTSLDLSVADYEKDYNSDYYIQESYKVSSAITLYVIDGDNLYPTSVTASSLKTYRLAGNDCDRIFMSVRAGNSNVIIAIRGKTSD